MIRDRIKELRRVRAGDLIPNPSNWRKHGEKQRSAMLGVLQEIGYADAVLARETKKGLEIIDGHLRAETTPDMEVPVLVLDVTAAEAKKILATLDPLAGMAGSDAVALDLLLHEVTFDDLGVREMLAELAAEAGLCQTANNASQDDVPAPPDAATTQPGDLWILGNHRLLCGDSSKATDVDRLLDGVPIHLVNTDPPYNVKVEPRSNNAIAAGLSSFQASTHHQKLDLARHPEKAKPTGKKLRAKDRPLENDFVSEEAFEELLAAWFGNIARVLEPGRSFYIWGGYANCGNYPPVLKAKELYFSQAIIWVKEHPVLTRKDFMGNHEWCFYGWREGAGHKFYGPNNVPDVWAVKKINPQSMIHLTEKPVELAVRAVQYSSLAGENVLDLFGGSGSTLMACEQTGRHAYLMEIDPLYCDVIVQRWEQFAEKKAKRIAAAGTDRPKRTPAIAAGVGTAHGK
jgi:DNA modification methylase